MRRLLSALAAASLAFVPSSLVGGDSVADSLLDAVQGGPDLGDLGREGLGRSGVDLSAAALATHQLDGIGWAAVAAGDRVVVGGTFRALRRPGVGSEELSEGDLRRDNLAVFHALTGLPTRCAPSVVDRTENAQSAVLALAVSPDGRTLYVGGRFTHVDGQPRANLAAIDLRRCAVRPSLAAGTDGTVSALAATTDTLYVGGAFQRLAGAPRSNLGAVSTRTSTATGWAPGADRQVHALLLQPGGDGVVVGGAFDRVAGRALHGLVVLDTAAGRVAHAFPRGTIPPTTVVKDLTGDRSGFYAAAEGFGAGVFDGRLAVDWGTWRERWRDTCLGATQAVVSYRGVVYSGSHAHDCSSMGGFGQGPRRHLLAQAVSDPTLLPWLVNTNGGIGEALGPRDLVVAEVSGRAALWVVGEFTTVNGAPQQGVAVLPAL